LGNQIITKSQYFVFKYTIDNTKSNSIDLVVNLDMTTTETPDNFGVRYAYTSTETDLSTDLSERSVFGNSFGQQTILSGGKGYIYVIFEVDNPDVDAVFEGTINWILTDKNEYESKYNYYEDLAQTLSVINNNTYQDDAFTTTKENAGVGLYLDTNNTPTIVLLKDVTLTSTLNLADDVNLILNGKTMTFNTNVGLSINANVGIDGRAENSKILVTTGTTNTTIIDVVTGTCTINGGMYESASTDLGTKASPNSGMIVQANAKLVMDSVKLTITDTNTGTRAGVTVANGGELNIDNADILATAPYGLGVAGIINNGVVKITDCNVYAYANYTANAQHTDYASDSRGIINEGTLTMIDCHVRGTHSGVTAAGTVYVDGGLFEGYGHGGFYFKGAETVSYVKNAQIRLCAMPEDYYDDGIAGTNKAGMYIGGANNVTVYMHNCDFYGSYYPLVMKKGCTGNKLYLSYCRINKDREKYIRCDIADNKLYLGVGNNFNAKDGVYIEDAVVATSENYANYFPEY